MHMSLKEGLIRKINQSIVISPSDRDRWTKYLNKDLEYT